VNAVSTETSARRPARETSRILGDCRDLAIHRLLLAFGEMLDKVGDMLMDRASRSDVRDEQTLYLDTRGTLIGGRSALIAEFERRLRVRIDDRIAGRSEPKADFSKVDATNLTLVDTTAMDESVVTGNITRVLENLCHDELFALNRGIGHLMGSPELETDRNPLAPEIIILAFAEALKNRKLDQKIRVTILKELNQAPLGEIGAIYADLNRHLVEQRVVPAAFRGPMISRGAGARAKSAHAHAPGDTAAPPRPIQAPEIDIMALYRRMFGGAPPAGPMAYGGSQGLPQGAATADAGGSFASAGTDALPQIDIPGGMRSVWLPAGPLAPTPSGYVPGDPIIATPELGEGIARLQRGERGFDVGGSLIQFSGIPEGKHNVLRDLQESPLGRKSTQLESMTIELVAMLFDFIFDTRDLTDGVKALLARLQIPVLKAAMLDGAFFAKKSHPSRVLVNALAAAGLGWSPAMGSDDPLYRKLEEIVHRVLNDFVDDLALFDTLREDLAEFLAQEEAAAEANISSSADEVNARDRRQIAEVVAKAEVERRIAGHPIPQFLADCLRRQWVPALEVVHARDGEDSEIWGQMVATLEDLVWSVQPKKTAEDRRHLVAMLPSLLKRMAAGTRGVSWPAEERDRFMSNLVEAHAASVKPSLAAVELPTVAVAEQAKITAIQAKAAGDDVAAAKAEQLAQAMAPAEPEPAEPEVEVVEDYFLEIAQSLERGMWIEFESEDGQLAFAKLAWVSPLRGTYLFTNRQGQKALSMTAEELAVRFRDDLARLVEAEPLIDRALSSVMATLGDKFPEPAAA
jgi:hypothetical protein